MEEDNEENDFTGTISTFDPGKQPNAEFKSLSLLEIACKPLKQEAIIRSTKNTEKLVSMKLYGIVGVYIDLYRNFNAAMFPRPYFCKAVQILQQRATKRVLIARTRTGISERADSCKATATGCAEIASSLGKDTDAVHSFQVTSLVTLMKPESPDEEDVVLLKDK